MQNTLLKGTTPVPFSPILMTKSDPERITLDPLFLKRHALFAGLNEEELKDLPVLFRVEQYQRGERIITEGERGGALYVIYRGGVDILKQVISREGECQQKIATLHQGDTFGEMELIDEQPRSATVIAQPDTVVLALDNLDLRKLNLINTRVYATMLLNLAREISRRLRATDQYLAVSLFSIREQSRFRLFPKD
jgi:CRP/FNR family cyclic AMP-dependent transcriptional regulator